MDQLYPPTAKSSSRLSFTSYQTALADPFEMDETEDTTPSDPHPRDRTYCDSCHNAIHPNPSSPPASTQPITGTNANRRARAHTRGETLPGSDPTCLPPITPRRIGRTLILCFDGTGDSFDNDISNIAAIFSMLKKDDKNVQMCYYQAGIGTYLGHRTSTPGLATLEKTVDQAVAWFLSQHVKEGYEFLMQNYAAGDKICLFGFSRGAYTARALAGMLHKVGLLPKDNRQQIPFAWRMYKDTSDEGWNLSHQFKAAFCAHVNIEFIGVFDTVSSVGVFGRGLPFTSTNYCIKNFRHAMALDERRARFKVNHWCWCKPEDEKGSGRNLGRKAVRKGHEEDWEGEHEVETDVKEVWFAGGHADVGGGNVPNDTPHSLARIPLRWMVRETFRCNTDILWDIDGLKKLGLEPDLLYPEVIVPWISDLDLDSPTDHHHTRHSSGDSANSGGGDSSPRSSNAESTSPLLSFLKRKFTSETTTSSAQEKESERQGLERVNSTDLTKDLSDKLAEYNNGGGHPELRDALCPQFDQLKIARVWWILELFPTKGRYQHEELHWEDHYFINLGRGRRVPKSRHGMLVHRTVKLRMMEHTKYTANAIFDCEPVWTD